MPAGCDGAARQEQGFTASPQPCCGPTLRFVSPGSSLAELEEAGKGPREVGGMEQWKIGAGGLPWGAGDGTREDGPEGSVGRGRGAWQGCCSWGPSALLWTQTSKQSPAGHLGCCRTQDPAMLLRLQVLHGSGTL